MLQQLLFKLIVLCVYIRSLNAEDPPVDCMKWTGLAHLSCCECQKTKTLACTKICPSGYFEIGNFVIRDGNPSACLQKFLVGFRGHMNGEVEKKGLLCGVCNVNCASCNGPTDNHCHECSSSSYKDVRSDLEGFDGEVRSKRMVPLDLGKIIGKSVSWNTSDGIFGQIFWRVRENRPNSKSSRRRRSNKRKLDPLHLSTTQGIANSEPSSTLSPFSTDGVTIEESTHRGSSFTSSKTTESNIISFSELERTSPKIFQPTTIMTTKRSQTSKGMKTEKVISKTSTSTSTKLYPELKIKVIATGKVNNELPSVTTTNIIRPSTTTPATTTAAPPMTTSKIDAIPNTIQESNETSISTPETTEPITIPSKTTRLFKTTTTTSVKPSTGTTTSVKPPTVTTTSVKPHVSETTKMETVSVSTAIKETEKPRTTPPILGSVFQHFKRAKIEPKTWFRCTAKCPPNKFIVRETKCQECTSSPCSGGRRCHVVDVHNVCVQSCQSGFIKPIGLMECLCPGPVINQSCSQPVHHIHTKIYTSKEDGIFRNFAIGLLAVIFIFMICAIIKFVSSKKRKIAKKNGGKGAGYLFSMSVIKYNCCGLGSTSMDKVGHDTVPKSYRKNSQLQEIISSDRQEQFWKEDTLGRITWNFNEFTSKQNSLYGQNIGRVDSPESSNQKKWRFPNKWQISTPPSIPKKQSSSTLNKVQDFLSRHSSDVESSKENGNNIYKQPTSTPKASRNGTGNISIISGSQTIPAEVVKSWLHSSFHSERTPRSIKNVPQITYSGSETESKQKRKSLRPPSNCYESIEGSNETEEAIYESLSEDEGGAGSLTDFRSRYFSSIPKLYETSDPRPLYANMEGPPLYDNS